MEIDSKAVPGRELGLNVIVPPLAGPRGKRGLLIYLFSHPTRTLAAPGGVGCPSRERRSLFRSADSARETPSKAKKSAKREGHPTPPPT